MDSPDQDRDLDPDYLSSLPPEVIFDILLDLNQRDISRLCQTSQYLSSFCQDWDLWTMKAQKDFDFPHQLFQDTPLTDPRQRYEEVRRILSHGKNSLIEATKGGYLPLVKYLLLRYQKDISQEDMNRFLAVASQHGHLPVVQYLVEHGATNLNEALINASQNGHLPVVQYLVEPGHGPRATNLNGALRWASYWAHLPVVQYLIEHGANDLNGALIKAFSSRNLPVVQYLQSILNQ